MPKKRDPNDQGTTTFTAAGSGLNTPAAGKLSSKIGKTKAELERERKPEKRVMGLDDAPRHTKGRWAHGEMEAVAGSLSDEYPLVDEPLILAILADYSPDSFYAALPDVQDDLAMLQASAVPDTNEDSLSDYPPAPSSGGQSVESSAKVENGLGFTIDHRQRPPLVSSRTSSSSTSSRQSQPDEPKTTPPILPRDFASTAPIKRYKTKRARSSLKILPRPSSRRASSNLNISARNISNHVPDASSSDSSHISVSPENVTSITPSPKSLSPSGSLADVGDLDDLFPSDIPHLAAVQPKVFVEVAPGTVPVEVIPDAGSTDTEGEEHETITETGLTTDDDDAKPESPFDPIKFLTEIFASIPPSEIQEVYEKAKSTGGDELEKAIEALLSVESIRDSEERGSWSDDEQEEPAVEREELAEKLEPDASINERSTPAPAESIPKPKLARKKSPPSGPKPNDRPLSLAVPLYGKVKSTPAENVAVCNVVSVGSPVRSPRPSKTKPPTPANLANRFASALHVEETNGNVSSGDESAGSTKSTGSMSRRKRVQVDAKPLPTKVVSSRPPPLVQKAFTSGKLPIVVQESPIASSFKLDSLATHLAELCNNDKASASHFLKYFRSPSYISTFAAMKAALEAIAVPRSQVLQEIGMFKEIAEASEEYAFLETKDLELCVRATAGDVSAALDLAGSIKGAMLSTADNPVWASHFDNTAQVSNDSEPDTMKPPNPAMVFAPRMAFPPSPTYPTAKKPNSSKRSVEHPQNWRTIDKNLKPKKKGNQHPLAEFIPAYAKGATPQDSRPGALYTDNEEILDYTMDECRRKANEERKRRQEAIRQAGKSVRSNVKGNGNQVAAYYASEARRAAERAKAWDLRAARELVDKQSAKHDQFCIDIHHLTLAEATSVCKEHVHNWHASQNYVPTPAKPFRIITGVGKHSTNYVAILRPGVTKALEDDGWRVDRGPSERGYIVVRGLKGA